MQVHQRGRQRAEALIECIANIQQPQRRRQGASG